MVTFAPDPNIPAAGLLRAGDTIDFAYKVIFVGSVSFTQQFDPIAASSPPDGGGVPVPAPNVLSAAGAALVAAFAHKFGARLIPA